jgi:hypothetical protein
MTISSNCHDRSEYYSGDTVFGRRRKRTQSQDAVVDRVLCLAPVWILGSVAADLRKGNRGDGQESVLPAVRRWLGSEALEKRLSAHERALMAEPVEGWSQRDITDASWRAESIGTLRWALSSIDALPPYDCEFEQPVDGVPVFRPSAGFRAAARLREAETIGRARVVAELWHWRSRTRQLVEHPDQEVEQAGFDLAGIACQTAAMAHAKGFIPAPIEGDFPALGKAYRALDGDEYAHVTSIAAERHRALNWLCCYSDDWDATPTAT